MRQALACVTPANIGASFTTNKENTILFRPAPVDGVLLRGIYPVRLQILHLYVITEDDTGHWSVHTTGYSYDIEGLEGHEVVTYHYDSRPELYGEPNPYTKPHLHVRGLNTPLPMGKAHFPTGRISIEEVLLFAIRELGIEVRRPDAVAFLEQGDAQFQARRSW
jgi:hypothetical protein